MTETVYFLKNDWEGDPYLLCRLNGETLTEEAFFTGQGGWKPYEFYLDLLNGDFDRVTEEKARDFNPVAFQTLP